VQAVILFY